MGGVKTLGAISMVHISDGGSQIAFYRQYFLK
jgi:hypothetical protein